MYKGLLTGICLTLSLTVFASPESICGEEDDRAPSFNHKVGRLAVEGQHKGCTVTMISDDCAISAGHCLPVLEIAEFNTPASIGGKPQPSKLEDVYMIDKDSIVLEDKGPGKDWAVLKIKRNHLTGKLPGEVQGHYDVSFQTPAKGSMLRITGYGADSPDDERHFAQQTHTGKFRGLAAWYGKAAFKHTVDTMGGSSGSSILDENTGEIIGIHTHGGCRTNGGANMGTMISKHKKLKAAIKACLNRK
ncbi:MAG: trypsin-like serine protease [Bacteriovoracaceae bacterium]